MNDLRATGLQRIALRVATMALCAVPCLAAAPAPDPDPMSWAFLGQVAAGGAPPAADALHTVPGSARTLTRAQIYNQFDIVDWFPDQHPAMPNGVAHGVKPDAAACGFCHLATGDGRPENAPIAGLPAEYIIEQVRQFTDGSRRSTVAEHVPTLNMIRSASAMPAREVAEAAAYFSSLRRRAYTRVKEADRIPAVQAASFVYRLNPGGGTEPLGRRIVEVTGDFERFELRDPHATYTAYVPRGSIARGARLAARKNAVLGLACTGCHGADLGGVGLMPPLAGKSPTYLMRQFINFRTGARSAPAAAPMREMVKGMSDDELIALAAYLGSLPVPERRTACQNVTCNPSR